ncbi:hypothetical protein MHYP_G00013120 [Metynnis hypsauchen]
MLFEPDLSGCVKSHPTGPSHSDLRRPDEPADPSPKPKSKAVTIGQANERILWTSLCAVLFVVALIIGVLFISGNVSHKETVHQLTEIQKKLKEEKKNISSELQWMKNNLTETQKSYTAMLAEKKNLQDIISRMEINVTETQKNYTAMLKERKNLQDMISTPCVDNTCCSEGWKYFKGKCYCFSTDVKTWTASRDACVTAGGDLVIISSLEEQDFIKRSKPGVGEQRYWVGLTDAVKEGDWRWLDGTRLSETPKYWTGNEPDNWEGENCAVMDLNTDSYALLDGFCDVEEKKFMFVFMYMT